MPAGVKATTEGSSIRPSASGITRGRPVSSSTYATRLLVVPRSMPMMRDMLSRAFFLAQRLPQILDDGLEISPGGESLFEELPELRTPRVVGGVPGRAERSGQLRVCLPQPLPQPLPLGPQRRPRPLIEPAGLGLGQGLLDLEHLLEQFGRRLGLDRRPFLRLPSLFQADEVLDPRDGVPQRPVGGVQPRGGVQRAGLLVEWGARVEVWVVAPRQLVELPLQLRHVDAQPTRQPEYFEVVHPTSGAGVARARVPAPFLFRLASDVRGSLDPLASGAGAPAPGRPAARPTPRPSCGSHRQKMKTGPPPGPFCVARAARLPRERRPAATGRLRVWIYEREAARQPLLHVVN